jgi:hypothetical protein
MLANTQWGHANVYFNEYTQKASLVVLGFGYPPPIFPLYPDGESNSGYKIESLAS